MSRNNRPTKEMLKELCETLLYLRGLIEEGKQQENRQIMLRMLIEQEREIEQKIIRNLMVWLKIN